MNRGGAGPNIGGHHAFHGDVDDVVTEAFNETRRSRRVGDGRPRLS